VDWPIKLLMRECQDHGNEDTADATILTLAKVCCYQLRGPGSRVADYIQMSLADTMDPGAVEKVRRLSALCDKQASPPLPMSRHSLSVVEVESYVASSGRVEKQQTKGRKSQRAFSLLI
jgi:hypothetical protein